MTDTFEQARQCVSRLLIESLCPGKGEWKGDDYWPCSPLRADSKPGSFHINLGGLWKDFASGEGGDIIQLVERLQGCKPLEAAKWILESTGHAPAPQAKPGRKPKPAWKAAPEGTKPIIPSAKALGIKHEGALPEPSLATPYRLADKTIAFWVLRWDKGILEEEKTVRPIHYTEAGTFISGIPERFKKDRPLLGLPRFQGAEPSPVLIVEGEKKAQEAVAPLKGVRAVTAWHGGADNARYVDLAPLSGWPDVVLWPDRDEPGRKAALALKERLPQLAILDVWNHHLEAIEATENPDGWDIADAIREGVDVARFIAECPRLSFAPPEGEPPDSREENDGDAPPFECIGYDPYQYWFLLGKQRQPYTIAKGHFSVSSLQELAPKSWWLARGCEGEKGGVAVQEAQDMVTAMQSARGLFYPDSLRGAGVWLDDGHIILNDSDRIIDIQGTVVPLSEYRGEAHYVRSSVRFGEMVGEDATAEEGATLLELFEAAMFERRIEAVAVAGWTLISPFGGILKVRPHVWITGRRGTGKTWLIEELISQVCGPFAHIGSGTDTEAGIRRTLNQDARPVILDESEPNNKNARGNMAKILNLARNSFSDGSGRVTMADSGSRGTVTFLIRSCFCFASVNSIQDEGAAINSRIITTELRKPETQADEDAKVAASMKLYRLAMRDPSRYRRRIFHALPRIIKDIASLRKVLPQFLGGQREADLWAPILAAAWAVQSDESISGEAGLAWAQGLIDEEKLTRAPLPEDEDTVVQHILASQLITDDRRARTVSELLQAVYNNTDGEGAAAENLLGRHGLRLMVVGGMHVLAVACRHDQLARMLRDTPYEARYDAQIKRNALCLNPDRPKQERMANAVQGCRLLDWQGFKARYMGAGDD